MTLDPRAILAEIEALSAPERFRLVAGLIEADRPELAHKIADRTTTELGAALALRILKGPNL